VQVGSNKKSPIAGESVASFARRTRSIGLISTRGAEVFSGGAWKKVSLSYIIKSGERVRPRLPASSQADPMGLTSIIKTLIKGQKK
jgi:hypothetical protein